MFVLSLFLGFLLPLFSFSPSYHTSFWRERGMRLFDFFLPTLLLATLKMGETASNEFQVLKDVQDRNFPWWSGIGSFVACATGQHSPGPSKTMHSIWGDSNVRNTLASQFLFLLALSIISWRENGGACADHSHETFQTWEITVFHIRCSYSPL